MKKSKMLELSLTREFLENIAGKEAIKLVDFCKNKNKGFTDEEVAKKLNVKITEVRAILNRLHYRGVACYQKTKNEQTGWYSYTWEIKPKRIAELILESQTEEIDKLEKKVDFEKDYVFFSCKERCDNVPFEVAVQYQFKCPRCGEKLNSIDNKKRLKEMKNQIDLITKELKQLQKNV